jgi:hypothetical protein
MNHLELFNRQLSLSSQVKLSLISQSFTHVSTAALSLYGFIGNSEIYITIQSIYSMVAISGLFHFGIVDDFYQALIENHERESPGLICTLFILGSTLILGTTVFQIIKISANLYLVVLSSMIISNFSAYINAYNNGRGLTQIYFISVLIERAIVISVLVILLLAKSSSSHLSYVWIPASLLLGLLFSLVITLASSFSQGQTRNFFIHRIPKIKRGFLLMISNFGSQGMIPVAVLCISSLAISDQIKRNMILPLSISSGLSAYFYQITTILNSSKRIISYPIMLRLRKMSTQLSILILFFSAYFMALWVGDKSLLVAYTFALLSLAMFTINSSLFLMLFQPYLRRMSMIAPLAYANTIPLLMLIAMSLILPNSIRFNILFFVPSLGITFLACSVVRNIIAEYAIRSRADYPLHPMAT